MPLVIPTKRLHHGTTAVFRKVLTFYRVRHRGAFDQTVELSIGRIVRQDTGWECYSEGIFVQRRCEYHLRELEGKWRSEIAMSDRDMGCYHIDQYLGIVPGKLDLEDSYAVRAYAKKVLAHFPLSSFIPGMEMS